MPPSTQTPNTNLPLIRAARPLRLHPPQLLLRRLPPPAPAHPQRHLQYRQSHTDAQPHPHFLGVVARERVRDLVAGRGLAAQLMSLIAVVSSRRTSSSTHEPRFITPNPSRPLTLTPLLTPPQSPLNQRRPQETHPITIASRSASRRSRSSSPVYTQILPPGNTNAFITGCFTTATSHLKLRRCFW